MNEIRGTSGWRNITQDEILKIGQGKVFGLIVNSHSSGKFKLYDGADSVLAVKATSTFTISGITPAVHAVNVLTIAGAISDDETVVIGAITYRFKNTTAQAYDVKIGASDAITLDNLKLAINGSGVGDGTDYHAGTIAHTLVIATTNTDTTQTIHSRTYGTGNNTLATTETMANGSWADTTLGGGTGASNPGVATAGATFDINGQSYYFTTELSESLGLTAVANEILWVTNDATALDNMKLAINGTGVEGTDYSSGTQAHPDVIATTNGNTTQVIEARLWGTIGNAITTTETMSNASWTSTTLTGGANGARLIMSEYTLPTGSSIITFPEPLEFFNGLYIDISSGTADLTPVWR